MQGSKEEIKENNKRIKRQIEFQAERQGWKVIQKNLESKLMEAELKIHQIEREKRKNNLVISGINIDEKRRDHRTFERKIGYQTTR